MAKIYIVASGIELGQMKEPFYLDKAKAQAALKVIRYSIMS